MVELFTLYKKTEASFLTLMKKEGVLKMSQTWKIIHLYCVFCMF